LIDSHRLSIATAAIFEASPLDKRSVWIDNDKRLVTAVGRLTSDR
jgi:hypothetical protein